MNCYIFDYSSCGIFKIIIPKELMDKGYVNNEKLEDLFKKYNLRTSECSWMTTNEDLEVVTLKK